MLPRCRPPARACASSVHVHAGSSLRGMGTRVMALPASSVTSRASKRATPPSSRTTTTGAPTAGIAKAAGVAEGTLFTYFATKDELLNQLFLELEAELAATMLDSFPASGRPRDRSRHLWDRLVDWSAANPARVFGLYPRKGAIQPGSDADIAVVDLGRKWTIEDAALQSRSKITPWNGRRVQGLPIHTLVRGRCVMRNRTLLPDTQGWGRSVHAIQRMPPARLRNADQTMQAIVRFREQAA